MINKLTKFFTASQQAAVKIPQPQTELPITETQAETTATPEQPPQPSAPENISLLKLCDAKLNKLAKFFSGAEEAPVIPIDTLPADSQDVAMEVPTAPVAAPEMEPEAAIARQPPFAQQTQPPASIAYSGAALPETEQNRDFKLAEQLLALEQQLEQHINEVKSAETGLLTFRDELQQQIAAHSAASGQQLIDHKNTLELMLKSAFNKIADTHTALESKFNRQFDPIQQALGTLQESIAEVSGTLHHVAEQTLQLQENMLQLNTAFEAFKARADIDSLNARLSALEKPPKRKSWFKK